MSSTPKECVELVEFLFKYPLDEIMAATSIRTFWEAKFFRDAGYSETAHELEDLAEVLSCVSLPGLKLTP